VTCYKIQVMSKVFGADIQLIPIVESIVNKI